MSKAFDEIMKMLDEKGAVDDAKAKELIKEHGPLTADEKKDIASAIKMKKALGGKGEDVGEVSMDDYLQALSVLDSDGASEEDKKKAKAAKEKFESS